MDATKRQPRGAAATPRLSRRAAGAVVLVVGSLAAVPLSDAPPARAEPARPNVLLIVTDDQRWDTLRVMPTVRRTLGREGTTFQNAFVVNPVCCPSRASILTGAYSHTTGVYTNGGHDPYGGFEVFRDRRTIATALHGSGYATGFAGKYLNGHHSSYVPPGWDSWFGIVRGSQKYA